MNKTYVCANRFSDSYSTFHADCLRYGDTHAAIRYSDWHWLPAEGRRSALVISNKDWTLGNRGVSTNATPTLGCNTKTREYGKRKWCTVTAGMHRLRVHPHSQIWGSFVGSMPPHVYKIANEHDLDFWVPQIWALYPFLELSPPLLSTPMGFDPPSCEGTARGGQRAQRCSGW